MRPTRLAILGAGRMGRELLAAIAADPSRWQLGGLWVRPGGEAAAGRLPGVAAGAVVSSDLAAVLDGVDVAVDFTLPSATLEILRAAVASGTPLVCGVSGLDGPQLDALRRASRSIPLFYERNMSVGIALIRRAIDEAGRVLGSGAEVLVRDLHHAAKIDAPSGTALALGETLAAARGQDFSKVMRFDAATGHGERQDPADIVFEVRREGSHPGRHTVELGGQGETLTFGHEVHDRRVFADGALRAAGWLVGREPGLYGMQDLLARAAD